MATSSTPYFLWDYALDEADVRAILKGDDEQQRAWLVARSTRGRAVSGYLAEHFIAGIARDFSEASTKASNTRRLGVCPFGLGH